MAFVLGHVGAVAFKLRHLLALVLRPVQCVRWLLSFVLWRLEAFEIWLLMLRSFRRGLLDFRSTWSFGSLIGAEVLHSWSPELWPLVSSQLRSEGTMLLRFAQPQI